MKPIFIDGDIEDPKAYAKDHPGTVMEDGNVKLSHWEEALECPVWVLHRSIPPKFSPESRKKRRSIAIMHGTTAHMLQNDIEDENLGNFNMHISLCWEWDATVAINRSDFEIMRMYDTNDTLAFIHDSVDLEQYPVEGTTVELGGNPTLISTDIVRNNKNPAYLIWAMKKIHERLPAARLEVCSLPLSSIVLWRNIIVRASEPVIPNKVHPYFMVKDIRPLMRGADIGFNTNMSGIPSRATLEQMALGKPVISYGGDYTPYHALSMDTSSIADAVCKCWKDLKKDTVGVTERTRAYAEEHFDMDKAVQKFIKLYEGAEPRTVR